MAVRDGVIRRAGEGLLVLVGFGVLSAGVKVHDLPVLLRILVVLVAIALLAPVRHLLTPEAWLADGPRSPGRHALSAGLFVLWCVLLIAVGSALGEVAMAALVLPGLAIGFVGSYVVGDAIADYCMSPQFTSMEPARDDPVDRTGPPG